MMDLNILRTLVFEKTGIKIDTGDPVFALVALNEAVLAECVEPHVATLHQAADKLNKQTGQLLEASERYRSLLQQLGETSDAGAASQVALALVKEQIGPNKLFGSERWHLIAGVTSVALLSAILTLCGQWALARQNPPHPVEQIKPAPPIVAALTPEQAQLIQNGEKYNKMWAKLDTKTRAKIQALLQQQ
jgi:hypothetical protein